MRLISKIDEEVLADGLNHVVKEFPADTQLHLLEVGVCHGDTSRWIRDWMHANTTTPWFFYGIDNNRDLPVQVPFDGACLITGESDQVYMNVPDELHFVFIDGCHDINHTMLDFLHYGDRVEENGILCFHDAAPRSQGKCDWQGYGPKDHPDFGTATREALRKLGLFQNYRKDWEFVTERWDESIDSGGVAMFKRVGARA